MHEPQGGTSTATREHRFTRSPPVGEAPPMELAAQLYTIRRAFEQDCFAALARLREIGYENVELAGLAGHAAREVRRALAASGLAAISMHVPLDRLATDYRAVVDEAATLGVEHVVVPWLDERYRRGDDYRRAGSHLTTFADRLRADDLALHFHNHDSELAGVDGQTPLDVLLESSGPALGLQLDLGWIRVAGHEPVAWLTRAAGRVSLIHVKDVANDGEPSPPFRPLGDGVIDWPPVLAASAAAGVAWAIVEDDDALDPFASLDRSRQMLRAIEVVS